MFRIILIILAGIAVFAFPFPLTILILIIAGSFVPPICIIAGLLLDLLYLPSGAVPLMTIIGIGGYGFTLWARYFVRFHIMIS